MDFFIYLFIYLFTYIYLFIYHICLLCLFCLLSLPIPYGPIELNWLLGARAAQADAEAKFSAAIEAALPVLETETADSAELSSTIAPLCQAVVERNAGKEQNAALALQPLLKKAFQHVSSHVTELLTDGVAQEVAESILYRIISLGASEITSPEIHELAEASRISSCICSTVRTLHEACAESTKCTSIDQATKLLSMHDAVQMAPQAAVRFAALLHYECPTRPQKG